MKMIFVSTSSGKDMLALEQNVLKSCTRLGEIDVTDDIVEALRAEQAGPELRTLACQFFRMGMAHAMPVVDMKAKADAHGQYATFLRACILAGHRARPSK